MDSIIDIISKVSRRSLAQRIKPVGGASLSDIQAFESRFNVQCPDELLTYLQVPGGMWRVPTLGMST